MPKPDSTNIMSKISSRYAGFKMVVKKRIFRLLTTQVYAFILHDIYKSTRSTEMGSDLVYMLKVVSKMLSMWVIKPAAITQRMKVDLKYYSYK